MNETMKEKLEKTKQVIYITDVIYKGKIYAQTMKILKNGMVYRYYEIENEEITEIKDTEILSHLTEKFETSDKKIY